MSVRPIFVFSLPRSGSTLFQSLLASHPEVASASEPWLLLPWLYSTKSGGVHAEYRHRVAARAIREFTEMLPQGARSYGEAIHDLAIRLYTDAAGDGASYFLDKTPRYHLVIGEIMELFPEGRFIFLWRNPLSVLASIIQTWGNGKWNIHHFFVDIRQGARNLVAAARRSGQFSIEVRYEDLVANPPATLERVGRYLNLTYDYSAMEDFRAVQLRGAMGDQVGLLSYRGISTQSVAKWPETLGNPLRKLWVRKYLEGLGHDLLARMGYPIDELLEQLDNAPNRLSGIFGDAFRMAYGELHWTVNRLVLEHSVGRPLGHLKRH